MSLFKKLFAREAEPHQRVRVCIECGMPVADHKDWCSIKRHQEEQDARVKSRASGRA